VRNKPPPPTKEKSPPQPASQKRALSYLPSQSQHTSGARAVVFFVLEHATRKHK
jgi:hypothetical protein